MAWLDSLHYRLACWLNEGDYPDAFDRGVAWFTILFTIPLASFEFLIWFGANL